MKSLVAVAVTALLMTSTLAVVSETPASAYVIKPCTMSKSDFYDGVGIAFTTTGQGIGAAATTAYASWNKKLARTLFYGVATGNSNRDVLVKTVHRGYDPKKIIYAETRTNCRFAFHDFAHYVDEPVIEINLDAWNRLDSGRKAVTFMHELGHAIGLDHSDNVPGCNATYEGIMLEDMQFYGYCGWHSPTSNDVVGMRKVLGW